MKNIRLFIILSTMCFLFAALPTNSHAVSSLTNSTTVHTEKKGLGNKIVSMYKRVKEKVINKTRSLFWLWAVLLIAAGIVVGFSLVVIGVLVGFAGGSVGTGIAALLILLLAFFGPIIGLYFAFRRLLKKHYALKEKDVTQRKINISSLLLSLVPGALASIYLLLI